MISIYDASGKLVRAYDLADLFQTEEIEGFRRSISSIYWRDDPVYLRQDQKTLLVTVKAGSDFLFGMESGQYKYCEPHAKTFRCRNANQPREWMPNSRVPLTR